MKEIPQIQFATRRAASDLDTTVSSAARSILDEDLASQLGALAGSLLMADMAMNEQNEFVYSYGQLEQFLRDTREEFNKKFPVRS